MRDVLLHGLYLKSFKGIGEEGLKISPLQKINLLVGPNNSGKSSVLQFLSKYLQKVADRRHPIDYAIEDVPLGKTTSEIQFGFGVPLELFAPDLQSSPGRELIGKLAVENVVWLTINGRARGWTFLDHSAASVSDFIPQHAWRTIWSLLTNQGGGDFQQHVLPETFRALGDIHKLELPKVRLIPAIRMISEGEALIDCSGSGLIDELAKLQNPDFNNRHLRPKFNAIEEFVRSVTGEGDATIEVPYERKHLLVHIAGKTLPLSSLGTGIHEVVIIAAFCTLAERELVCLEEPEIHLHPLLQRKLLRFLNSKTSNQYVIATHSAAILDAVPAAIFSVSQNQGRTEIRLTSKPSERFEICKSLGYQASDILQSNAIIWVEGPSDRIYLLHWIASADMHLVEGIDFSIMFYGGRLLSHLTAQDEEITEFISLRRLNRHVAVVMDSDKKSRGARINATKMRIANELDDGFIWITAGREIENYIPAHMTKDVLNEVCGGAFGSAPLSGIYDHALLYRDKRGHDQAADKVKFARAVARRPADLSVLDLRKRVGDLVAFIRKASEHRYEA